MTSVPLIKLSYHNTNSKKQKISCSEDAYKVFKGHYDDDTIELREEFRVAFLNRANEVLGVMLLSTGSSSGTMVDLKHLFSAATLSNSAGMILAHNHPSSQIIPSEADRRLTKKIVQAGELLSIAVLDHLIISKEDHFSFADEGLM